MTREVKLSLILGFALVLVVGVLLSDHLSGARQANLQAVHPESGLTFDPAPANANMAPDLVLVNEQGQPIPPPSQWQAQTQPVHQAPAPAVPQADPGRIASAPSTGETAGGHSPTMLDELRNRFASGVSAAVNDLANGQTPPPGVAFSGDGLQFAPPVDAPPSMTPDVQPVERARVEPRPIFIDEPRLTPGQTEARAASASESDDEPGFRLYQVRDGETLWSIAAQQMGNGAKHKELLAINRDRLGRDGTLKAGASIRIPTGEAPVKFEVPADEAPVKADRRDTRPAAEPKNQKKPETRPAPPASSDKIASNQRSKPITKPETPKNDKPEPAAKPAGKGTYTVRKGDTLGEIASKLLGSSSRYEDILAANTDKLSDEESLQPGMVLKIPSR